MESIYETLGMTPYIIQLLGTNQKAFLAYFSKAYLQSVFQTLFKSNFNLNNTL